MLGKFFAPLAMKIGAAIIAILLALLAVQTIRLEGFKVWPISIEGARPKAERLQGVIDQFDKAQDDARKAAELAKAKAEADYRNLAERIDDESEKARVGAMDDAERFIAANRVRCAPDRGAGGGTVATAADNGTRGGQGASGATLMDDAVAVTAEDVRICTRNTLQAEAAREWALELEGLSERPTR